MTVSRAYSAIHQHAPNLHRRQLRARLGRELDALREIDDVIYVSKRGQLAGVLLDVDRYADLVERLEHLEDSVAAHQARDERDVAIPWPDEANSG